MRNFKQKRKSAIILILAVCVTLIVILCVILTNMIGNIIKKRSEYIVTAELINISDNGYNPANDRQYDASARLFVWNDTLYFFMTPDNKKAQFRGELCAFKNNTVVSYGKMYMLCATKNGYVYYENQKSGFFRPTMEIELMCLNLANGNTEYLSTIPNVSWHDIFFAEDRTSCYIPKDREKTEGYYIAKDGALSESVEIPERYTLGNNQYAMENANLVRYDEAGNRVVIKENLPTKTRCLIPCNNGLLLYSGNAGNALRYIPEDSQELIELFCHSGYAHTAVNVHNDYVYLSYERLNEQKFDFIATRAKDDTIFGTYRISLKDYSVERLNDVIYDGLYIFDDTGIYATKDGCIYKLDFDGNVIMTLME